MATTWSSIGSRSAQVVVDSGTGAAPSADTDGIACDSAGVVQLVLSADNTRTLSGAGTLNAYVYDAAVGRWARCPDLDVAVGVSAVRDQAWGGVKIEGGRGRVAWVPSGVTVSAGGTTVYLLAAGIRDAREGGPL